MKANKLSWNLNLNVKFGGTQAPSKQIILLQCVSFKTTDICEIAHYEFLCFCMNPGHGLHLNTSPAKLPFIFPLSAAMSVNFDDYFQSSF